MIPPLTARLERWMQELCDQPDLTAGRLDRYGSPLNLIDPGPMAGNAEAMDDLRRILSGRAAFYSKADLKVDTSGQDLARSFDLLRTTVREAISNAH